MARQLAGDTWQPATAVAPVEDGGQIATSGGRALVVWDQQPPEGSLRSMYGAAFDGSAWSAPQLLETEDTVDHGWWFDVTLRRGHAGLAAWVRIVDDGPQELRSIAGALFGDD